ncbi:dTDP-4-dehydrorhamnose 3,5-epimerase [Spirillospora sp. NPDC047279]|uniref:dTDP-4-dehydrorhamnose 3,5-epimerase family protein n=1 Tax=Spirillospora sp. NPDC047279 TaxID=3155478 RepID=UPI00340ACF1D
MKVDALDIDGSYLIRPTIFPDDRGLFLEVLSQPAFAEAVGRPFPVAQVNCTSTVRGTIRGLHAVALPPGQAGYTTCVNGAVLDIVVDVRVGSPTFGRHHAVVLDDQERHALYLAEGLAHGFAPLTDEATVLYLSSRLHSGTGAIGVNALDPDLALPWPDGGGEPRLSDKDRAAPTLREAARSGLLPGYAECRRQYALDRDAAARRDQDGAGRRDQDAAGRRDQDGAARRDRVG